MNVKMHGLFGDDLEKNLAFLGAAEGIKLRALDFIGKFASNDLLISFVQQTVDSVEHLGLLKAQLDAVDKEMFRRKYHVE